MAQCQPQLWVQQLGHQIVLVQPLHDEHEFARRRMPVCKSGAQTRSGVGRGLPVGVIFPEG